MAQQYVTDSAVLTRPGAYPDIKVQKQNSGLATTGVIMLVGEADAGPDFSLESDITQNFFGPDAAAEVVAKYVSGPIVEAYRAASAPANDADILGAPAAFILVKTNVSGKAQRSLARAGNASGVYGVLAHTGFGNSGNMLSASVTAQVSEVAPTTGAFAYIPGPELGSDGSTLALRVNGGAKQTVAVAAQSLPSVLVGSIVSGSATGLNNLNDVLATGGLDRGVLTSLSNSATLAVSVSGNSVTITLGVASAWNVTPTVGDTLVIPADATFGATTPSVIAGGSDQNLGAYVVTAATSTTVTATKLRDLTALSVSAPASVTASAIGTDHTDFLCFSPVTITAMKGTARNALTGLVGATIQGVATGSSLKLTLQTGQVWAALPSVGDTLFIPKTAPAAYHASGANGGWYTVTAATTGTAAAASTITATRLSNGNPASFAATAISAVSDIQVFRPAIDGVGKTLEIFDGGGVLDVSTILKTTAGAAVGFVSTSGSPYLLTSASEYKAKLAISRQSDSLSEEVIAGGDIALLVGYNGTAASLTVSNTTLTTSVTGGDGSALSLTLKDFKTLSDLAAYINVQTGYTCAVGTALVGQSPVVKDGKSVLDQGTYTICSEQGAKPGRIKRDAFAFFRELTATSHNVQLGVTTVAQAAAGLPEIQSTMFLSGGTRGGSTSAQVVAGFDVLEKVRANFVVPCFSRDATDDIADGLTDSSSSYEIDAINAAAKTHVLKMSTVKRRRNRQAFLSKKTSFTQAKLAANNLASARVALAFQDVKNVALDGSITQFASYMLAALAAGMQSAGFYRSIMHKGINCTGVVVADGSYSESLDSDVEDALKNGLLIAERAETGGFRWVSDQTTYAADDNFVYNSVQAMYAGDVVALTTAQRMENAFVGQSTADVSAAVALSYLKGIMTDLKRLKLLASSDDAPLGFRNATIRISGNAMIVKVEIKLATAIAFIPISFLVTMVEQTAS